MLARSSNGTSPSAWAPPISRTSTCARGLALRSSDGSCITTTSQATWRRQTLPGRCDTHQLPEPLKPASTRVRAAGPHLGPVAADAVGGEVAELEVLERVGDVADRIVLRAVGMDANQHEAVAVGVLGVQHLVAGDREVLRAEDAPLDLDEH